MTETHSQHPEGGAEGRQKPDRHSARLIGALAKKRAWVESMTEEQRTALVEKLFAHMELCETPREIASIAKAISALETNDIARARLLVEVEKAEDGSGSAEESVRLLREAARQIREQEGT